MKFARESMTQNLKDAGCLKEDIDLFFMFYENNKESEALSVLKKQRAALLEKIHMEQKKLDNLDYLIYEMKKKG